MNYVLLSVYDVKTQMYSQPFMQKTTAEAIRSFSSSCKDPSTNLHQFPEDYSLNVIGEFNEDTAEIKSFAPRPIANATEFVKKD